MRQWWQGSEKDELLRLPMVGLQQHKRAVFHHPSRHRYTTSRVVKKGFPVARSDGLAAT
jgi:hypothetical protein